MAFNRTAGSVLRSDLIGAFHGFDPSAQGFIADMVLPPLTVPNIKDTFKKVKAEELASVEDTRRKQDGKFNRGSAKLDDDSYEALEDAWEEQVDNTDAKIHGGVIQAQELATMRAAGIIRRNREVRVAAEIFNITNWPLSGTTGASVSVEWNSASGVPITDVLEARDIVRRKIGRPANTIVMSAKVYKNLGTNAQMVDRIKSISSAVTNGMLGLPDLARLFELPRVLVGGSVKNSNGEGLSFSGADIWDDEYVWIGYVDEGRDLKIPQAGRTFVWNATGGEVVIEGYPEPQSDSEIIRARQWTDEKIVYTEAGYLLGNITT